MGGTLNNEVLLMTYITDQQLADRFQVFRTTIWRWRRTDPSFPRPVKLSPGCARWRLDEVEAWEAAKSGQLTPHTTDK